MVVDFNKIKTEISLPDLMRKYGWKHTVGSTSRSPKLTNGQQTVVIKRNPQGFYTYWDVHNESIRAKTAIDFMTQQITEDTGKKPTLREVGEVLQTFLNNNEIVLPENSKYDVQSGQITDKEINIHLQTLQPYVYDNSFLAQRGITESTLNSKTFKDVFFLKKHQSNGNIHNNTVVKMISARGIQGFSLRNESFKGIIGNRFDSIAASNFDNTKPIDEIYIGESMIDCISHFQMKNANTNKNILYISTEGNLSEGQCNTIKQIIEKNNIKEITTLFDNDDAGLRYTKLLFQKITGTDLSVAETQEIKDFSFLSNETTLKVDLPQTKDFNDDLKKNHLSL